MMFKNQISSTHTQINDLATQVLQLLQQQGLNINQMREVLAAADDRVNAYAYQVMDATAFLLVAEAPFPVAD